MKKRFSLAVNFNSKKFNFAVCVDAANENDCIITRESVVKILKQAGGISAKENEVTFTSREITKVDYENSTKTKYTLIPDEKVSEVSLN